MPGSPAFFPTPSPIRPAVAALGAGLLTLGLAFGGTATAHAQDSAAATVPAGQLTAMQRDLGLSPTEARELLAAEAEARDVEGALRSALGDDVAGTVFDIDTHQLTVQVTDAAAVDAVEAAGAETEIVEHGEGELADAVTDLDAAADDAGDTVYGWYADTASDTVVVTAAEGASADAAEFAAAAGVDADLVTVEEEAEAPELRIDILGGTPYYFPLGGRTSVCSVGLPIVGGYVTAGHCGEAGSGVFADTDLTQRLGTVTESVFPGQDSAYVTTVSPYNPVPRVSNYSGGSVTVTGSTEAQVGASVCRSGRTTGWHCGTLSATNQTVNYISGDVVHGLTRTTACSESGDSGGPYLAGTEAQGVLSGGSGNCRSGGTSFFQPVNPILQQWNLTLLTG